MAHDRLALFQFGGFEMKPHAHMLRAGATQPQLFRQVAAQRARDEQHRLAIFDRLIELPMRAREKGWTPGGEQVGLEAPREQDCMTAVTTELAFQLARADRRHRAQRAKTKEIQSFELLPVERQLVRGEGGEESLRIVDLNQAARS